MLTLQVVESHFIISIGKRIQQKNTKSQHFWFFFAIRVFIHKVCKNIKILKYFFQFSEYSVSGAGVISNSTNMLYQLSSGTIIHVSQNKKYKVTQINLKFLLATTLKLCIFDPKSMKPKCILVFQLFLYNFQNRCMPLKHILALPT